MKKIQALFSSLIYRNTRLGELLISHGAIKSIDLELALNAQSETGKRLGQVLIEKGFITQSALRRILLRQIVLRVTIIALTTVFSIGASSKINTAHAGDFGSDLIKMVSLSNNENLSLDSNTRLLFGSGEKRSKDISAFTKWNVMFKRFENEFHSDSNKNIVNAWRSELEPLKQLSLEEKAIKVNQIMNGVHYASDNKVWGKSDFWATPIEFLQQGSGDCEDYAISKYASLKALGVPEDRLRIVILQDTAKNLAHAILVVYANSGVMVLDNQAKTVKYDTEISNYKPIYSINRSGWWLHKNSTVIASR